MKNQVRKSNTQRINDLKAQGCKVFIKHHRVISRASFENDRPKIVNEIYPITEIQEHNWSFEDKSLFWFIEAKGGETYIRVENKDTGEILTKTRLVCSSKDNYNKAKALNICLGRIEKQLN